MKEVNLIPQKRRFLWKEFLKLNPSNRDLIRVMEEIPFAMEAAWQEFVRNNPGDEELMDIIYNISSLPSLQKRALAILLSKERINGKVIAGIFASCHNQQFRDDIIKRLVGQSNEEEMFEFLGSVVIAVVFEERKQSIRRIAKKWLQFKPPLKHIEKITKTLPYLAKEMMDYLVQTTEKPDLNARLRKFISYFSSSYMVRVCNGQKEIYLSEEEKIELLEKITQLILANNPTADDMFFLYGIKIFSHLDDDKKEMILMKIWYSDVKIEKGQAAYFFYDVIVSAPRLREKVIEKLRKMDNIELLYDLFNLISRDRDEINQKTAQEFCKVIKERAQELFRENNFFSIMEEKKWTGKDLIVMVVRKIILGIINLLGEKDAEKAWDTFLAIVEKQTKDDIIFVILTIKEMEVKESQARIIKKVIQKLFALLANLMDNVKEIINILDVTTDIKEDSLLLQERAIQLILEEDMERLKTAEFSRVSSGFVEVSMLRLEKALVFSSNFPNMEKEIVERKKRWMNLEKEREEKYDMGKKVDKAINELLRKD